jgi:hypothetical protein
MGISPFPLLSPVQKTTSNSSGLPPLHLCTVVGSSYNNLAGRKALHPTYQRLR